MRYKVDILYLPENPEKDIILKAAADPKKFTPIQRYSVGLGVFLGGLIAFIIGIVIAKKINRPDSPPTGA